MVGRAPLDRTRIGRRALIALAGAAMLPAQARAQAGRRATIAWLGTGTRELQKHFSDAFIKGMAEFGRVEGRDYEIVYRYAEGNLDRLRPLADELVKLQPTILLVGSTPTAIAARQATTTIPILAATFSDPVGFGLIQGFARPGTNVSGLVNYIETLPGKLMSLAIDAKPGSKRLGLVLNLSTPQNVIYRRDSLDAAGKLGVALEIAEVREVGDLAGAIDKLKRAQVDFAVFLQDAMFLNERNRLAELTAAAKLPALFSFREHVAAGGLMSFGQKLTENYRRIAFYVDRVLKGAKVGDLPIEFPTGFELLLNLKTAKDLGLEFPILILAQAEEVIE